MKQFTGKYGPLFLVPSNTKRAESPMETRARVLRESFDEWLDEVAPTLIQAKCFGDEASKTHTVQQDLSNTEVTRGDRATVRESDLTDLLTT